jgi:hypothetical protein
MISSHTPLKGSLWVHRQPRTRFLLSCSRYRVWSPAAGSGALLEAWTLPIVHYSAEKTRTGAEGVFEIKGGTLTAKRKTASGELASQIEVSWPLPLTDITSYLLADHLPLRSEINTIPDGGWMARMVSFSAVVQSLLPLWQDRWQKQQSEGKGVLALVVDDERCVLELSPSGMRQLDRLSEDEQELRFSQQVFTQLVFGFRPVSLAAIQAGQYVPDELVPILDVLFPHKHSWIS